MRNLQPPRFVISFFEPSSLASCRHPWPRAHTIPWFWPFLVLKSYDGISTRLSALSTTKLNELTMWGANRNKLPASYHFSPAPSRTFTFCDSRPFYTFLQLFLSLSTYTIQKKEKKRKAISSLETRQIIVPLNPGTRLTMPKMQKALINPNTLNHNQLRPLKSLPFLFAYLIAHLPPKRGVLLLN
jgi:hypothetical protein